ncbi:MAG: PKD domain-containing protein [Fibrobacteria bacterium]|nr:PKD domain-containing protein [Fibrobacteria bacterium]
MENYSFLDSIYHQNKNLEHGVPSVEQGEAILSEITDVLIDLPVSIDFSGTPISGNYPLDVSFTATNTGGPTTSWLWEFGDGATSTVQNPSHQYTTAGNYQVILSATGPGGNDVEIKSNYITVTHPEPSIDFFGTPTSGDYPLNISFTTTNTGGPVTSLFWDFGDGFNSTFPNPNHLYTTAGSFTVTVTATGPAGNDVTTITNYITVTHPAPDVDFSVSSTSGDFPLTVSFTSINTGGPVESWFWDFGDGNTSTAQNPTHTYTQDGSYTVRLVGDGPERNDAIIKNNLINVTISAPIVDFSANIGEEEHSLWATFQASNTGGPVSSWNWDFGDGNTSSTENPGHQYTSGGTYTVTLTAQGLGGIDAETKIGYITVTPPYPIIDFTASSTSGNYPKSVTFAATNTGGPINSWLWEFGDGSTSSVQNPIHQYLLPGNYTVTLSALGPHGNDLEAKTNYIIVTTPVPSVDFSASTTIGQYPVNVDFSASNSGGPVVSWHWDFGDGATSSSQNPNHQYTVSGTYTVILTASGPDGNDIETKTNYITVTTPEPSIDFSTSQTSGVNSLDVSFTVTNTGGPIDSLLWDFGDGATSIEQNPTHYYSNLGSYTVSLTAIGPDGTDVETKVDYVRVNPPIVSTVIAPLLLN